MDDLSASMRITRGMSLHVNIFLQSTLVFNGLTHNFWVNVESMTKSKQVQDEQNLLKN